MSDHSVSPEVRDKLAQQLQENLKRRRPRTRLWLLLALPLLAAALYGLWQLSKMPPPLPPLMLVVFDALEGDGGTIEAQLVSPGNPDTNLEGLEVHWKMQHVGIDEAATTKTDRSGMTRYRLGAGDKLKGRERPMIRVFNPEMHVSFIDPAGAYRRDKSVKLTSREMFGDEIVIVPLEDDLARDIDWIATELANLPRPPSRAALGVEGCKSPFSGRECWVIYTSGGAIDAMAYQSMRDWLKHYQTHPEGKVPAGPLLRERADAVARRFRGGLAGDKVRIWGGAD